MAFKVTKQFVRDVETYIADFFHLADARNFIAQKMLQDSINKFQIIYRSYQDENLLQEFNPDKDGVLLCRPQYAQGDVSFPSLGQTWLVAQGNVQNPEQQLAFFSEKNDAFFFMEMKALADEKSTATYYLIYNGRIVGTLDHQTLQTRKAKSEAAQAQENKVIFYPTPLRTSPRLGPGGNYKVVEEKKEDGEDNETP